MLRSVPLAYDREELWNKNDYFRFITKNNSQNKADYKLD